MNYSKKEKYKLYALISLLISIFFIPFISYDFLYFLKINEVIKVIISLLFLAISIIFFYKFFSISFDCIQSEEITLKTQDLKTLQKKIYNKYNKLSIEQEEHYTISYYEAKEQKKSILFVFNTKEINKDVVDAIEEKISSYKNKYNKKILYQHKKYKMKVLCFVEHLTSFSEFLESSIIIKNERGVACSIVIPLLISTQNNKLYVSKFYINSKYLRDYFLSQKEMLIKELFSK